MFVGFDKTFYIYGLSMAYILHLIDITKMHKNRKLLNKTKMMLISKRFFLIALWFLLLSGCDSSMEPERFDTYIDQATILEAEVTGEPLPSGSSYTLNWQALTGAEGYLVEESRTRDFAVKETYRTEDTHCTITSRQGVARVNFYRVSPVNSHEPRPWSNTVRVIFGQDDDVVEFGDPILASKLKPGDSEITVADLAGFLKVDIRDVTLTSIEELFFCKGTQTFWLFGCVVSDLNVLAEMVNLSSISIGNIFPPLTSLYMFEESEPDSIKVDYLRITDCGLNDISSLKNFLKLETIYLYDNHITNISALRNLPKLRYVDLRSNQISDISPLVDNPYFYNSGSQGSPGYSDKELYLKGNPLDSVSIYVHITALKKRHIQVSY